MTTNCRLAASSLLRAVAVAGMVALGGCADVQREFEALAPSEDFIRDLIERVDTYAGYPAPRLDPGMRPAAPSRPAVAAAAPPSIPPAPPPVAPTATPAQDSYVVRPGDTLFGLARANGTTPRAIVEANELGDRTALRTGERLTIPRAAAAPPVPAAAPTSSDRPGDSPLAATPPAAQAANAPLAPVTSQPLPPPAAVTPPPTTVTPIVPGVTAGTRTEAEQRLTAPVDPARAPAASAQAGGAASPPAAPAPPAVSAALPGPAAADDGGGRFAWPLRGPLISGFGSKADGVRNDGINIKADSGAPVHAAASGVVVYAGNELRGFGELLLIRHTDGLTSAYAHNSELLVRRGQRVRRGQIISRVGQSGSVSSPQLHFEIRQGSQPVDPMRYLGG